MKTEEQKVVYLHGQKIPVTEEVYKAWYGSIWKARRRARHFHQCALGDWRRCEGDCALCRYWRAGDEVPMDDVLEKSERAPEAFGADPADIAAADLEREEVLEEMERIDPLGRRIGELLLAGFDDRFAARILGLAKSTFSDRKMKIRRALIKLFKQADWQGR